MRLRGVYINCELMREAQFYSQLHGEPQWELSSQVSLSAKRDLTRQLKSTRWSRRCNETKMTIVEMPCNTNWFGTPYLIVSRSLSTEIHVLGMAKKKKCCTMLYHVAPCCTMLHHVAPCCTMLHHVAPCCTILHQLAPCCTILHHLEPSCILLHHLLPSCTILNYLALSCTILHYLALSCTIFYYLAISCNILHYLAVMSCCTHKVFTCSQQMSPVISFDIAVVAEKVTIANCQWFLRRPSPLNVFGLSDHCHQWF